MFFFITLFLLFILFNIFTRDLFLARHYAYGKYVLRHKWYVFQECITLGVPLWIAILHDWDKFLPSEWIPYAESFYAEDGSKQYKPNEGFTFGWNAHQKKNKHHWQYWMITWDKGNTECLPMPDVYRREMLADWRGAGRAIHGKDETIVWYTANRENMKLHAHTRLWIEQQLGYTSDE